MTVWFTSDIHFGHKNILKFCKRPFATVEEMDETLIRRWQETVEPGDAVYVVGDFSFYRAPKTNDILKQLPGQKFLIKGNHDHSKALKKTLGWTWVRDYYELKVEGQLIVLCHYAFEVWRDSHKGSWHLHGHSHGTIKPRGLRMDVGVDHIGYEPGLVCFEEVEIYMERRAVHIVDHHKQGVM